MPRARFLRRWRRGAACLALGSCLQPMVACSGLDPRTAGSGGTGRASTGLADRLAASLSPDLLPVPALFEATGTARWDGRRTLQGVWVAHPQASGARRVRIYNAATGATVDGALFTRDPVLTGPSMLVSSDAAGLLGMAPGEEAELRVVAVTPHAEIRPGTITTPVVSPSAPPPATGMLAAADPRDAPARAAARQGGSQTAPAAAGVAARAAAPPLTPGPSAGATRRPAPDSAPAAPDAVPTASAVPALAAAAHGAHPLGASPAADAAPRQLAASAPAQPYVQAGVFAVRDNANRLIRRLDAAGLQALGKPARLATGPAIRVLAGPFATAAERDAARRRIQAMGLGDAVPVAR